MGKPKNKIKNHEPYFGKVRQAYDSGLTAWATTLWYTNYELAELTSRPTNELVQLLQLRNLRDEYKYTGQTGDRSDRWRENLHKRRGFSEGVPTASPSLVNEAFSTAGSLPGGITCVKTSPLM